MPSRHSVGTYQGNEHTLVNSSGNTRPPSSQLAEQLWTDPGVNSGISVRELISALRERDRETDRQTETERRREIGEPSPKIRASRRKFYHFFRGGRV